MTFGGPGALNSSLIIYNFADNGKAPLVGERLRIYSRIKRKALKRAGSKECREFLRKLNKATGNYLYQTAFLENAIEAKKAYDGLKSTINLFKAGATTDANSTETVQRHINNDPNVIAVTGALTPGTRHDSYFNVTSKYFSSVIVTHEALHSLLGKDDFDIAVEINLVSPPTTDDEWELFYRNKSAYITKRLTENGCGK